ncbi:hypothetical protein DRA42_01450 [Ethanoligenens harbinense]|nr:hypothetical protein CXQ68_01440 [Ethanoligenens harbinense YUAN-3]AYF37717.1 hypothetical protein CXP51_01450 [Ethanoligenens harbinense]AYF40436.1 hypothetical protein CN246_01440 [Ethanoligenens harbinense]QCN91271.1 hypothetical protein DRA42_01450 [Ethanoligenens harbinense]
MHSLILARMAVGMRGMSCIIWKHAFGTAFKRLSHAVPAPAGFFACVTNPSCIFENVVANCGPMC